MLIKGVDLTPEQRRIVLAAYVYRRYNTLYKNDEQWLAAYSFPFIKDGSRLAFNRRYCVAL